MLDIVSLLAPEGVSRELLYGVTTIDAPAARFSLSRRRRSIAVTRHAIDEALSRLADSSLLTFSTDGSVVTAHRLVMRVVRERRAHDGTLLAVGASANSLVGAAMHSFGQPWEHRDAARDLVRHVLTLDERLASQLAGDSGPLAVRLIAARGWALGCLNLLGDSFGQSIELGEPLLADCLRLLGAEHEETRAIRHNLARAYVEDGREDRAIPLYEEEVAVSARVLGEDHPDTLISRNDLATAYGAAGRFEEAVPLIERTLAGYVRVLGDDHPDTLMARNNLAFAYDGTGRLAEAVALYERTLADRVRVLCEDHPDTLLSRNNLAGVYESSGRLGEAIALYEQTLADRMRVLGGSHPQALA
ncbi:MAG TPA: tetratricopeptide repeat protein [Trebonia sp.]|nr:tetratricopeptide repeat protein [Trebonia sp.]